MGPTPQEQAIDRGINPDREFKITHVQCSRPVLHNSHNTRYRYPDYTDRFPIVESPTSHSSQKHCNVWSNNYVMNMRFLWVCLSRSHFLFFHKRHTNAFENMRILLLVLFIFILMNFFPLLFGFKLFCRIGKVWLLVCNGWRLWFNKKIEINVSFITVNGVRKTGAYVIFNYSEIYLRIHCERC